MQNPKVSVIMPAFNSGKYISKSIDSVLAQKYTNFELLIIDDCSTDNTIDIVKAYINKYSNIYLYQNTVNSGPAFSRNRGVNLSSGAYIAFLDSDDLWDSTKLIQQVSLIKKNPQIRLCFTGSAFIDEADQFYNYTLNVPATINKKALLKQNLISCSSVLIDKKTISKYPMPVTSSPMHEDFATWLKILDEIEFAYGIDSPLLIYRLSQTSKSGNKLKSALMNWNTYKYADVPIFSRIYNMLLYTVNGLLKYKKLQKI